MVAVAGVAGALAFSRVTPLGAVCAGFGLALTWILLYVPSREVGGVALDDWLALAWLTAVMAGVSMPSPNRASGRCTSFPPGALFKAATARVSVPGPTREPGTTTWPPAPDSAGL
jgi:hypothetical protein